MLGALHAAWGSSAPYWGESFLVMQSPLALQLPSAGCSAFLLESFRPCWALRAGAGWELLRTSAFRCGCWQAARPLIRLRSRSATLGLGCVANRLLWACVRGSQPLIQVRTHRRFQVWAPSYGFRCGLPCHLWRCTPTQALWVCVPRQPGRLSGCASTERFTCGHPVR